MGKTRSQIQNSLFVFPGDLKVEQFNPLYKLLYQFGGLCAGFNVGKHDGNELIVVEEVDILYDLGFHFGEDVDHVIVLLLYVVGVVHYHLD